MVNAPTNDDEPVQPTAEETPPAVAREGHVPLADALDQARGVGPAEQFDPPSVDDDEIEPGASEYDALEQARTVAVDDEDYAR